MREITTEEIKQALHSLWEHRWLILLVTLAGVFAGLFLTSDQQPNISYRAAATVCVTYGSPQEQAAGSDVMTRYSDLVRSLRVCQSAADRLPGLGLTAEQIQEMVTHWVAGSSYIMTIEATTNHPEVAAQVVNAVAESFVEHISSISGNQSLQVLDLAAGAVVHSNSQDNTIRIAAGGGAFLLVCAVIALRRLFSDKVWSVSQCAEDEDEILAILPEIEEGWG